MQKFSRCGKKCIDWAKKKKMQQKCTNDGEGKKVDSEEKCGKQETNRDQMSKNVQMCK